MRLASIALEPTRLELAGGKQCPANPFTRINGRRWMLVPYGNKMRDRNLAMSVLMRNGLDPPRFHFKGCGNELTPRPY